MPQPASALKLDGANDAEVEKLCAHLRTQYSSPDWRPPLLPAVAVEVLRLSQSEECGIEDIVLVLERDPLLAGRVLKLAQSSYYAGSARVTTLTQAAVRLGICQLRNAVLEVAVNVRLFHCKGYAEVLAQVQAHSLAVAYVSQMVAKRCGTSVDFAFLLGLFHDVGFAAAVTLLGDQQVLPPPSVVLPALRRVHEDAGGVLARAWKLPEALCEAVPTHHDISGDGTICALAVAEHLVEEIAAVADPSVGEGDRTRYDNAIKMLRLDKGALQKLGQDAERIVTLALEEYGT